jgi:hypothetical protein
MECTAYQKNICDNLHIIKENLSEAFMSTAEKTTET